MDFLDEKPKEDRMLFGIFILDFLGGKSFLYGEKIAKTIHVTSFTVNQGNLHVEIIKTP